MLVAPGARGDSWEDCVAHDNIDHRILSCTQIIERDNREGRERRAMAFSNRGSAYAEKGEYAQAIADHTKAIALDPYDASSYDARAWAYLEWDKAELGLLDAQRAVELAPGNASILGTRGQIYAALERRDEAIADLLIGLSIQPDNERIRKALQRLGVLPRSLLSIILPLCGPSERNIPGSNFMPLRSIPTALIIGGCVPSLGGL